MTDYIKVGILPIKKQGTPAVGQKPTDTDGVPCRISVIDWMNGVNIYDHSLKQKISANFLAVFRCYVILKEICRNFRRVKEKL